MRNRAGGGVSCLVGLVLCVLGVSQGMSQPDYLAFNDEQVANAIWKAEGGDKTSHPYGILKHYKNTTPRQACINTIAHARKDYMVVCREVDFIEFLGSRYCPVNCDNDNGTNKYWIKNVKYFLEKER